MRNQRRRKLIDVNDADLSLLWIGLGVAGATSLQEHEMSKDLDDLFPNNGTVPWPRDRAQPEVHGNDEIGIGPAGAPSRQSTSARPQCGQNPRKLRLRVSMPA